MTENKPMAFYHRLIPQWIEDKDASILVVAGSLNDRNTFLEEGFHNVVVSNIDTRTKGDEFAPFSWAYQDAENLNYKDNEFDYTVVHAGLHHCPSPHRALLEMYRVARRGVIFLESRDSLLIQFLQSLKVVLTYEVPTVYYNGLGGVNNSEIPNYIYRWTEREIEKTILAYAPYARHTFHYRYENAMPSLGMCERAIKGRLISYIPIIAKPIYLIFKLLFPRQQNLFACMIEKPVVPRDLHEWIVVKNGEMGFNKEWADTLFS